MQGDPAAMVIYASHAHEMYFVSTCKGYLVTVYPPWRLKS